MVVGSPRDEGFLQLVLGSVDPTLRIAFDFRHDTWEGVETTLPENAVRVDDLDAAAPFRYLRFRDPPYDDAHLHALADRIRPLLVEGVDVYCYFRHEDEPSAPAYAERLRALIA